MRGRYGLEKMTKCLECEKLFPDHLIQDMAIGDQTGLSYVPLDPVCALKIRNQTAGLPLDTPFQGEMANALWEEAVEYLKSNEQKTKQTKN